MNEEKPLAYHNDFENNSIFLGFTSSEMNIIAAISSEMLNKGLTEITFSFSYLKKITNWKRTDTDEFIEALSRAYNKLIKYDFRIGTKREFIKFVLFTRYKISGEEQTISVKVNEEFFYILNNLTGNYTCFELEDFITLNSTYSKLLYKFLMRWQNEKQPIYLTIDEFRKKLGIPENYKMSHIDQKILRPIEKELSNIFEEFKVEKIKSGKTITQINFYYKLKNKDRTKKIKFEEIKEAEKIEEDVFLTDSNLIKLKDFFKEIGLNLTEKHKKHLKNLLKNNSPSFIFGHFKEQYNLLKNKKNVKDIPALMSKHIFEGTCEAINRKEDEEKLEERKQEKIYESIINKFSSLDEKEKERIINEILSQDKFKFLTTVKNSPIIYRFIFREIEKKLGEKYE